MNKHSILVLLSFLSSMAIGQTKRETVDWLLAKLKPVMIDAYKDGLMIKEDSLFVPNSAENDGSGWKVNQGCFVPLRNIRSIQLTSKNKIILIGHFYFCDDYLKNKNAFTIKEDCTYYISEGTPANDINSIIKALKHLATLNGARLLNEDLF